MTTFLPLTTTQHTEHGLRASDWCLRSNLIFIRSREQVNGGFY